MSSTRSPSEVNRPSACASPGSLYSTGTMTVTFMRALSERSGGFWSIRLPAGRAFPGGGHPSLRAPPPGGGGTPCATRSRHTSRSRRWRGPRGGTGRSEEHTSELQSHHDLVCRLLLEKKNKKTYLLNSCNIQKKKKIQ